MAVLLKLLVLKTHQLEAMRAFYQALGVDLVEEQHGKGPAHFAGQVGGVVLEIYPLADGEAESSARLGFSVADLDGMFQRLQASGTTVVSKPQQTEWGHRAVVRDPDGRSVELYQG